MTVRHVAMLQWTDDATDEQKQAAIDALLGLAGLVPGMVAYTAGNDLGVAGTADAAIVVDFDDVASMQAYLAHPTHAAVAAAHVAPILARSLRVQIAI